MVTFTVMPSLMHAADARLPGVLDSASSASRRLQLTPDVSAQLLRDLNSAPSETRAAIQQLPPAKIKERIDGYLTAKERALGNQPSAAADFQDFRWGYVKQRSTLIPLTFQASEPIHLNGLIINGTSEPVNRILDASHSLPWVTAKEGGRLSITALTDRGNVSWTISGDFENKAQLLPVRFSRGCPVHIESIPAGASVYFNGHKWRDVTPIDVIREAGKCAVTLEKDGYESYKQEKSLDDGESFVVDASLKPSH